MGGIWKPADRKRYRIWYKDHLGERQTAAGFRDKAATEARLRSLERDEERRAAGLPVADRRGKSEPLDGLITRHIADLRRQGVGTDHWRHVNGNLRRLAKWNEWTLLAHVNHKAMQSALAKLDEDDYSSRSLQAYRVSWKSFMEWCVDGGILEGNPLARIKANRATKVPKKKRAFTVAEWRALLSSSPARRSQAYLIAGLTGLRWREMKRLERRDVDLVGNRLKLRGEATKAKRADVVPLVPDVVQPLTEACKGLPAHARIFRMPCHRSISADIARAGIVSPGQDGRYITFHSLRYFFCTLLARTLPIQVVRLLMRHADISQTCKVYLDLGLDDVAEAALKIPPLF